MSDERDVQAASEFTAEAERLAGGPDDVPRAYPVLRKWLDLQAERDKALAERDRLRGVLDEIGYLAALSGKPNLANLCRTALAAHEQPRKESE